MYFSFFKNLVGSNFSDSMEIRSIIVEDNLLNIEVLADLLEEAHKNVKVVGKAMNGIEALNLIKTLDPDLVFLDIEMPDMNGFEVLASLESINFQTIFVTAHSQYAIQAIRFNALDYLVKPLNPKELSHALRRFRSKNYASFNKAQVQEALKNMNQRSVLDQMLYLPTQEGGIKMILRDIIKIEGDRNYSTFHLANGKTKVSSKTLGYFEETLQGKGFFRCHRSFIVNYYHIDKLQKDSFTLKDASKVPISRRRKTDTKAWFNRASED